MLTKFYNFFIFFYKLHKNHYKCCKISFQVKSFKNPQKCLKMQRKPIVINITNRTLDLLFLFCKKKTYMSTKFTLHTKIKKIELYF